MAAPFAGSDGGERAGFVATGPGMKVEDMLVARIELRSENKGTR